MGENEAGHVPVLVTGTHRSGTTWVGQMLSISPELYYIHEPFAPMHERAWVRNPPPERYLYREPESGGELDDDLDRIVALRPPSLHIARRTISARNVVRVSQEALQASAARRRSARALIKDPFALLLAEWIEVRTRAAVVVLVRHPAAFASSVKRLGWKLDTRHLLSQPRLVQRHLEPYRAELERDSRGGTDIIDHASLVWRVLNSVVEQYEVRHPGWVVRYEDLARDPVEGFRSLSQRVGIAWSDRLHREIAQRNDPAQGADVPEGAKGGTDRDSTRAMWTWTQRLTDEEVQRVRGATAGLAERWYGAEDWIAPAAGSER